MLFKIALALLITHAVVIVGKKWYIQRAIYREQNATTDIDLAIIIFTELAEDPQFTKSDRDKFERVKRRLENLKAFSVKTISIADLKELLVEFGIDFENF